MGTQEFYADLDIKKNQLKNVRIDVLEAVPTSSSSDEKGRIVTFAGDFYVSNGTKWVKMADDAVVQTLKTTVGGDSSGLVKDVKDLQDAVGTGSSTGTTITSRVTALEGVVGKEAGEGSEATGLVKSVADNANAISTNTANIATNKTTAEAAKSKADANEAAISNLKTTVETAEKDIDALEKKVGASTDGADATGSLYARTIKNAVDISTLTQAVANNKNAAETGLADKVDKVNGKQLSTEDFTAAFKTKLEGIDTGAQVNKVTDVQVDKVSVLDGTVAVIDLTPYAKKADLASAYVYKGSVEDISNLPTSGQTPGDVYNVEKQFTYDDKVYPAGTNVAWNGTTSKWDPLGGTVDLSPYATTESMNTALKGKQDNLTEAQLAAANSGITTTKVSTYDEYSKLITEAKSAADAAQATANKKVDALTTTKPTTGSYTKVTVSAEGLVTEGVAQTDADIPELAASKITSGVFDLDRIPIMAVQETATLAAGSTVTVNSGMKTALVAQVLDGNNKVVFCETTISGGSVVLGSSVAGTVKVNIIGLR